MGDWNDTKEERARLYGEAILRNPGSTEFIVLLDIINILEHRYHVSSHLSGAFAAGIIKEFYDDSRTF